MPSLKHLRLLLTLALLLLSAAAARAQPIDFAEHDPGDYAYDDYYLNTVNGQPYGYWHAWLTVRDGLIYSGYEEVGVEAHGGELMHTRTRSEWIETLDYQPVTITVQTEAGTDTVTQVYRFTDDGIELTSTQNGRETQRHLPPIAGEYLTGAQLEVALAVLTERGDDAFDLNTISPDSGLVPFVSSYRKDAEGGAAFELADGEAVEATRWVATYSNMPGLEIDVWLDDDQHCVGVSYTFGDLLVVSALANESVTQQAFEPPELAYLSVVTPDRPIDDVLQQRRIVYELSYDDGDAQLMPIATLHQSVELIEPGRARVTVDLENVQRDNALASDAPAEGSLEASIRIDHEDRVVRRLAERAVRRLPDNKTDLDIAHAAKTFVTRYLTGVSLSVGDGTASEAARTRSGDCTECSVLLAAILRAHGIPSRCVTGLVYTDEAFVGQEQVFVYHMWTQAWIATGEDTGYWIDLDAAVWEYTAGHIALGVSNMGDNDQQDDLRLIPLSNGLQISVRETTR